MLEYNRKMQLAQAGIAGEAQVVQTRYAAESQKMMAEAMPQQPGMDPNAMDPNAGGLPTGQEGEMVPGPEVDPAMPTGSSVSLENAQQAPNEGIPEEMQSPLTMGMQGGGFNLLYLAQRAATELGGYDEATKFTELNKMKMTNPQLYSLTLQILNSRKGSQLDPLDPIDSPAPEQRPSRRPSSTGV